MRPWTGSWRWIMLILFAWGTLLFYIGGHLVRDNDHPDHSSRELSKILAKLERLKQQNEDLRRMAESLRIPEGPIDQGPASGRVRALEEQLLKAKEQIENYKKQTRNGLGKDHEILRRRIENGAKELWFFLQSELKKLKNLEGNVLQRHADEFLSDLGHHERSIMTDLYYLSQTDGAGDWREREAKDLTELVQRRITYLQNPKDCSKAKKLVCNINKGCGYGCQLHHVVYCFMIAYGTQRTLILESQNWRYATGGWETVFRPVSETCTDRSGTSTGHWSGEVKDKNVQVVELPIVDSLHPRPPYLPLAIPEDLADRLVRVHGDPAVWWVSQFVKYLIRPQPWLEKEIEEATKKLGFKHPVIGVHVRRTDKVGTEAAFHPIEEYMVHVEEHFQLLARRMHVDKRRVYLATDDPSLLKEAKTKYPTYEFISDNSISWSAGLHNRYTENSLRGVILDIHFLSQADFLVCTFSSQSPFQISIVITAAASPSLTRAPSCCAVAAPFITISTEPGLTQVRVRGLLKVEDRVQSWRERRAESFRAWSVKISQHRGSLSPGPLLSSCHIEKNYGFLVILRSPPPHLGRLGRGWGGCGAWDAGCPAE
uniref:Fucosyltransferase 8 n=1 Tax=Ailuropoda melanoleuca TaxID=9646 RepID=A0A7N5KIK7_AILME